jgi:nitroreductase
MELKDAQYTRRSIRSFTDYYVTDDEIREIIHAGRMAPSWANTQAWHFIVLRDRDTIVKVTDCYSETNPARKCSADASALIVVCAEKGRSGHGKDGSLRTRFAEWFMFDLGMAVQNMSLAVHDLALGTVVVGSIDHGKIDEICHVPQSHQTVVVLPLGKPLKVPEKAPRRKELEECTSLDSFDEKFHNG